MELGVASLANDIELGLTQILLAFVQDDGILPDAVVDVLSQHKVRSESICDALTLVADMSEDTQSRMCELLDELMSNNLLELSDMKLILPTPMLESAGIINNATVAHRLVVRHRTDAVFTQKKFNLFREESEGYSKLITVLVSHNQNSGVSLSDKLRALVGVFDLDPNRVLDAVLTHFAICISDLESQVELIKLLSLFNRESISHILGFKLGRFKSYETPIEFVQLAGFLVARSIIDLSKIYVHLDPSDEELVQRRTEYLQQLENAKSNVTSTSLSLDETFVTIAPQPLSMDWGARSGKLGFVSSLIQFGSWEIAKNLIDHLSSVLPASHEGISCALVKRVSSIIEPWYSNLAQYSCLRQVPLPNCTKVSDEAFLVLEQLLEVLSIYLCRDRIFFAKLCRVFKALYMEDKFRTRIFSIIKSSLLPAYCLISQCHGASTELWGLLVQFPYMKRYELYRFMLDHVYTTYPELKLVKIIVDKVISFYSKRLVASKMKEFGRQLVRCAGNNHILLIESFLTQLMMFDNLAEPIVETWKSFSSISLDMANYVLLSKFSNVMKTKIKPREMHPQLWFTSLASFSGLFFKKYPEVWSTNPSIIQYVVNQLKNDSAIDVLILKDIFSTALGIGVKENMTREQILGQAGGKVLRSEVMEIDGSKPRSRNSRQTPPFIRLLLKDDFLLSLMVHLAQEKSHVVFKHIDLPTQKMAAMVYDHLQDVFVQLLEFVHTYMNKDELVQCLPSLYTLVSDYHLDPVDSFYITRTVLGEPGMLDAPEYDTNIMVEDGEMLDPLFTAVSHFLPKEAWDSISPSFYATFWRLTMYDIFVPEKQYEDSLERLRMYASDKKRPTYYANRISDLTAEFEVQKKNTRDVLDKLRPCASLWFEGCSNHADRIDVILQYCIFPRCFTSDIDALYCAHFLLFCHDANTPSFSIIALFTKLINSISALTSTCTANEIERVSLFLSELLSKLLLWNESEEVYTKRCANLVNSCIYSPDMETLASTRLTYVEFGSFIGTLYSSLTVALRTSLTASSHLANRNALLVMTQITPHFPQVAEHAEQLAQVASTMTSADNKGMDTYALASRVKASFTQLSKSLPSLAVFSHAPTQSSRATNISGDTSSVKANAVTDDPISYTESVIEFVQSEIPANDTGSSMSVSCVPSIQSSPVKSEDMVIDSPTLEYDPIEETTEVLDEVKTSESSLLVNSKANLHHIDPQRALLLEHKEEDSSTVGTRSSNQLSAQTESKLPLIDPERAALLERRERSPSRSSSDTCKSSMTEPSNPPIDPKRAALLDQREKPTSRRSTDTSKSSNSKDVNPPIDPQRAALLDRRENSTSRRSSDTSKSAQSESLNPANDSQRAPLLDRREKPTSRRSSNCSRSSKSEPVNPPIDPQRAMLLERKERPSSRRTSDTSKPPREPSSSSRASQVSTQRGVQHARNERPPAAQRSGDVSRPPRGARRVVRDDTIENARMLARSSVSVRSTRNPSRTRESSRDRNRDRARDARRAPSKRGASPQRESRRDDSKRRRTDEPESKGLYSSKFDRTTRDDSRNSRRSDRRR